MKHPLVVVINKKFLLNICIKFILTLISMSVLLNNIYIVSQYGVFSSTSKICYPSCIIIK